MVRRGRKIDLRGAKNFCGWDPATYDSTGTFEHPTSLRGTDGTADTGDGKGDRNRGRHSRSGDACKIWPVPGTNDRSDSSQKSRIAASQRVRRDSHRYLQFVHPAKSIALATLSANLTQSASAPKLVFPQ